ncbi:hypothetical protein [Actinocorallia longicatena]|uniref:Uncharacterized protein n=1 Tax=Actinocorallia longicatena TaxID=111803 RepID=A0ABP6Q006_9ACTN
MSAKGIGKRDAERLLRGLPAGQDADPLADLLAAVAVPGTASELAGEEIAVATFRMALDSPVVVLGRTSSTRGRGRSSAWTARAVTVKAVGLAVAVTAVCGGAVIAAGNAGRTGPTVVPSATTPAPLPPAPTVAPSPEKLTRKQAPKAKVKPGTKKAQTAELADLCKAFLGRKADTAGLDRLIKAAGGRKDVLGYCFTLLGKDAGRPQDWPQWPLRPARDDKALERWIKDQKKAWDSLLTP